MKTKLLATLILSLAIGLAKADIVIVVYGAGGIVVCGGTTTICPKESNAHCQTITIIDNGNCDGVRGYVFEGDERINFILDKPLDIFTDEAGNIASYGFTANSENSD
ncbi:hypothetical protein SDC9_31685 [bioreactor metagenome]|jgi:hypothetical protein|uniref:Uncharacterized protein n=1 Tax=bioreactor metagenome TaxID=1076179 RepID=A0A644V4H6_9ZZZZ|nr:hypothetical protein [Lentimicrobium sp.]MEA5112009.1 hypothetical protein [Lentimicrobium sp.]